MGRLEPRGNRGGAAGGARHELVKLDLQVADARHAAALEQMLEQLVLAALDIDLHQVDPLESEVVEHVGGGAHRHDPPLAVAAQHRRAVSRHHELDIARRTRQPERMHTDARSGEP